MPSRSSAHEATTSLVAKGISFSYREPLLRGVDLRLESGQCVALLGANGAGKTTLLRLLGGLLQPDAGGVWLDGDPIQSLPAQRRARRVGYLPQRIPSAPGFAVYEIVMMGLYALLPAHGWESAREWLAVGRALRRVGAQGLLRRPFDELSGGEQRRILLARALVAEPGLLLLDEPFAALDPGFELELEDTLVKLKRQGVAMVIATHRLSLVRTIADRVVVLRAGRVLAEGPPQTVLTAEVLDATYATDRFSRRTSRRPTFGEGQPV